MSNETSINYEIGKSKSVPAVGIKPTTHVLTTHTSHITVPLNHNGLKISLTKYFINRS